MTACDYCLSDCSDDGHSLDDEGCDPSRECFHVDLGGHDEGNHLGMPEDDDPPGPASRVDVLRELAVVPVFAGGGGVRTHSSSKSVRCRPSSTRKQDNLCSSGKTLSRSGQVEHSPEKRVIRPETSSAVSLTMPGQGCPRPPVGLARTWLQRRYYSERCRSHPPSRGGISRGNSRISWRMPRSDGPRALPPEGKGAPTEHRATTSRPMREASVHTGRTRDATPAASGRLGNEHHRRDRRARLDEKVHRGYHPRRGGRYDSEEDWSPSPKPPGLQAFSRAIRRAPFLTRFRAPTTITKYSGETRPELWLADYRLACQLGRKDDDNLIIHNLPLFLSDAARAWLEHLPLAQISNWDDLVKAFAGNFQGTYVRTGNSWDLRSYRQHPGESLREYIRWFSKQRTELPNITDSDVIVAFLASTTCRDLVRLWSGGGRSHLPEGQAASGTPAGRHL
jgi:hypothetical protein